MDELYLMGAGAHVLKTIPLRGPGGWAPRHDGPEGALSEGRGVGYERQVFPTTTVLNPKGAVR